jgi:hypothetical protein
MALQMLCRITLDPVEKFDFQECIELGIPWYVSREIRLASSLVTKTGIFNSILCWSSRIRRRPDEALATSLSSCGEMECCLWLKEWTHVNKIYFS